MYYDNDYDYYYVFVYFTNSCERRSVSEPRHLLWASPGQRSAGTEQHGCLGACEQSAALPVREDFRPPGEEHLHRQDHEHEGLT